MICTHDSNGLQTPSDLAMGLVGADIGQIESSQQGNSESLSVLKGATQKVAIMPLN